MMSICYWIILNSPCCVCEIKDSGKKKPKKEARSFIFTQTPLKFAYSDWVIVFTISKFSACIFSEYKPTLALNPKFSSLSNLKAWGGGEGGSKRRQSGDSSRNQGQS